MEWNYFVTLEKRHRDRVEKLKIMSYEKNISNTPPSLPSPTSPPLPATGKPNTREKANELGRRGGMKPS